MGLINLSASDSTPPSPPQTLTNTQPPLTHKIRAVVQQLEVAVGSWPRSEIQIQGLSLLDLSVDSYSVGSLSKHEKYQYSLSPASNSVHWPGSQMITNS